LNGFVVWLREKRERRAEKVACRRNKNDREGDTV